MLAGYSYYKNAKRRTKNSKFVAFGRSFNGPPSPASFASPEILEHLAYPQPPSLEKPARSLTPCDDPNRLSPMVQLEIATEPLSDWFHSHALPSTYNIEMEQHPHSSRGNGLASESSVSGVESAESPNGSGSHESSSEHAGTYESVGGTMMSSSEDSRRTNNSPLTNKRGAPSPIKIPNSSIHGPKILIERSSVSFAPSSSRPDSSNSNMSAMSGTTLARALIGNSFVLSGDPRSSRRRSSGIIRQDSATLPRGEHPFLNSPYWRDRRISGGESLKSPDSRRGSIVPPVPPMPSGDVLSLGLKIAEPSTDFKGQTAHAIDLKEKASLSSLESHYETDEDHESVKEEVGDETQEGRAFSAKIELKSFRRISPISEGASSRSSGLEKAHADIGKNSLGVVDLTLSPGSTSSQTDDNRDSKSDSNVLVSLTKPRRKAAGRSLTEPTSASCSAESGQDLDNILAHYHASGSERKLSRAMDAMDEPTPPLLLSPSEIGRRNSKRGEYGGKVLLMGSSSPRGRLDWSLVRTSRESRLLGASTQDVNTARLRALLPIGERPRSILLSPHPSLPSPSHSDSRHAPHSHASKLFAGSSSKPSSIKSSSPNALQGGPSVSSLLSSDHESALPPASRNAFIRSRMGNAPSPITVVRDSKDYNAYKITVGPDVTGSPGSTPTTGEPVNHGQTFPETPNAFSPTWSAGTVASPGTRRDDEFAPASLAQQVLLTRAATSVRSSRHSTNLSTRSRSARAMHPYARPGSDVLSSHEEHEEEDDSNSIRSTISYGEALSMIGGSSRFSVIKPLPRSPIDAHPEAVDEQPEPLATQSEVNELSAETRDVARRFSLRPLPLQPPSIPTLAPIPSSLQPIINASASPSHSSSNVISPRPNAVRPHPPLPSSEPNASISQSLIALRGMPQPATLPPPSSTNPTAMNTRPVPRRSMSPPSPISPPPPPFSLPQIEIDSGNLFPNGFIVPPPSYYSVFADRERRSSEQAEISGQTPSSGGFDNRASSRERLNSTQPQDVISPTTNANLSSMNNVRPSPAGNASSPGETSAAYNRRTRARPRLPIGPRKPVQQIAALQSAGFRKRSSGSSTVLGPLSSGSAGPSTARRQMHSPTSVPKFRVPPLKWKTYTMDAAKWTFSSNELQNIVSRAIKKSAESSSIRLLRVDAADNEIPDDIGRLEMLQLDLKRRYKSLTRSRAGILESLACFMDQSQHREGRGPVGLRLVDELAEVSLSIDQVAEELHIVDEQISQLRTMCDVHSASALAMALRKLNTSFLKKVAELSVLRTRMEEMEAERDEAWKQAEEVANDYDILRKAMPEQSEDSHTPVPTTSERSSRVMAVRKSSIRASQAGLRYSHLRRSQRSSTSSNAHRSSFSRAPSIRSIALSPAGIPPVPRIPQTRSSGLRRNFSQRDPAALSSTCTPSSATRALVQVEEELYAMLGMSVDDFGGNQRRPRSMTVLSSDGDTRSSLSEDQRPLSTTSRPSSMPGHDGLSKLNHSMSADHQAILATLGLLSDP